MLKIGLVNVDSRNFPVSLKRLGYLPYVMIYDKHNAPRNVRFLQRWVNNRKIFRSCDKFEEYNPQIG